MDDKKMDLMANYDDMIDSSYYIMRGKTEEKRAIRPLVVEDRILAVEQKFFCDRTTEKTVTLTVTDNQDTPVVIKCSGFPIMKSSIDIRHI